ncbi:hypothetical protein NQ317_019601 [Molorchus minor]|uniref:Uncharacterized protein n=1 Tax=Molorchus minor TaxID=1323400 RepID=A0ABQ9JCR0_9CUCU|nr:hypothetical protein NQ317_019601 [Molorchus minor]
MPVHLSEKQTLFCRSSAGDEPAKDEDNNCNCGCPPVPTAQILGGPDLHVDKGSTINLTCSIRFSPRSRQPTSSGIIMMTSCLYLILLGHAVVKMVENALQLASVQFSSETTETDFACDEVKSRSMFRIATLDLCKGVENYPVLLKCRWIFLDGWMDFGTH